MTVVPDPIKENWTQQSNWLNNFEQPIRMLKMRSAEIYAQYFLKT